jgi:hypothetical protein
LAARSDVGIATYRGSDQRQCAILGSGVGLGHCMRRLAGALADFGHVLLDIHVNDGWLVIGE